MPFLKVVCPDWIRTQQERNRQVFGCGIALNEIVPRSRKRRYSWNESMQWRADGMIFGHFLSPTSDDAVVSGAGAESHPYLWGGTLLLTKKDGKWRPVWYKMGVVTRHCRRISLATGRQILFCEETDGGMGHVYHFLYTIDLLKPISARDSTVFIADSFDSELIGGVQEQYIDRVVFDQTSPEELSVRIFARHGGFKLRSKDKDRLDRGWWPNPKVRAYRIDLRLEGDRLMVTPETASIAKPFGIK